MRAFLALGSNLGDRLEALVGAVRGLAGIGGVEVVATSRVYETVPVGPAQPDYLNAVISVQTDRSPRSLLEAALSVERDLGRIRAERWGPRTIDVDLLTCGRLIVDEPGLAVPHPRMHERAFVIVPLLELEPDPVLPGGRSIDGLRPAGPGWSDPVRAFAPALPIP